MAKRQWQVTLDGQPHMILFRHSPWTNKRAKLVDGSQIDLPKEQRKAQWDTGTKYEFEVAGHEAILATRSSGFDFEPHIYIDDRDV
jgi:hypothetical protein